MDNKDKEIIDIVNTAILLRKFRIVKRSIRINSECHYTVKKQYTVQIGHKFIFWYWWKYVLKNRFGMVEWVSDIDTCKNWIYNKCLQNNRKIEVVGLLPYE